MKREAERARKDAAARAAKKDARRLQRERERRERGIPMPVAPLTLTLTLSPRFLACCCVHALTYHPSHAHPLRPPLPHPRPSYRPMSAGYSTQSTALVAVHCRSMRGKIIRNG